jgi:hypothetical protein
MTRDEAVQFARDCWDAFNAMSLDEWRAHVNALTIGQPDLWRKQALAWMEMSFSVARAAGVK